MHLRPIIDMKYIKLHEDGTLEVSQKEIHIPSPTQKLIKVAYAGVNRADLLQRQGLYLSEYGLGLEVSGVDIETNEKVAALLPGGGYSEYVVAEKANILYCGSDFDLALAAALPEALATSWMALMDKGQLQFQQPQAEQETVLIHSGSSGVGHIMLQVAKLYGAYVMTTAGAEDKFDFCKALGADAAVMYESFVESFASSVDVVVDILGGDIFNNNLKVLRKNGKLVILAVMQGSYANVNLASVLMKNISVFGTTLRSKEANKKAEYIAKVQEFLMPHVRAGKICPVIDSIFEFTDIEQAHERMRSRKHLGKILIRF